MEMEGPVGQVTIVGGGTAGWMTALMLRTRMDADRRGPRPRITLIESPTVKIIGVGEGTLPGFVEEMKTLGVPEPEFARRCSASFKLGVRFDGWNRTEEGRPYAFTHPFTYGQSCGGKNALLHCLSFGPHPGADPRDVADSLDGIPQAIRLNRAPYGIGRDAPPVRFARYGYHFDAARLAEFMRDLSVRRGVEHVLDDVDDAVVEGERITHLSLRERGLVPVELVIDCTGFKGLLISKYLKEPFLPYAPHLLCDRALALQIPHRDPTAMESCTTATALGAGWVWRVPLFHRVGTGYVFSGAFRKDDDAVLEYCRHIGVDPHKAEARVIPMRVGRSRRAWVGNCIAVGLSGGFIEPLEATAIMTIQVTAMNIFRHFPDRSMQPGLRDRFNRLVAQYQDGIRDFILMHYYLSNREEPFWRAARSPEVLTESLRENLEVWAHRLPYGDDLPATSMFNHMSYGICLAAKGFYGGRTLALQSNVSPAHWRGYGAQLGALKAEVRRLPSVRELLLHLRGESSPPRQVIGDLAFA